MTKKKTELVPVYVAHIRRNEIDGNTYNRGDTTSLEGLTAEQIGYVVGRGYFGVQNPDTLPDDVVEAIKKEMG